MADSISAGLARRIALAAQGFGRQGSATPAGTRALGGLIRRLGVLQIDSVNVFERSHYLPALSRLGPYPKHKLDALLHGPSSTTVEYWAHQAAFIPRTSWPLFEFRRQWYRNQAADSWLGAHRQLADWLHAELAEKGPLPASAIEHDANKRRGPWWGWSDVKRTLEEMFRTGDVICADRRRFERIYALPEHVLENSLLEQSIPEADAIRDLIEIAATALGIATEADLADYFRMSRRQARQAILDLEDAGVLRRVDVNGHTRAWLHRDARRPRRLEAVALLSPFDPVVWYRPRAEWLYDFHYRIEIYTPEPKRVYGYYSLPLLLDDSIVGRVDLKNDRKHGLLRIQSAWAEPTAPDNTAARLAPVLGQIALWQGLTDIVSTGRGNLAAELAGSLRS